MISGPTVVVNFRKLELGMSFWESSRVGMERGAKTEFTKSVEFHRKFVECPCARPYHGWVPVSAPFSPRGLLLFWFGRKYAQGVD